MGSNPTPTEPRRADARRNRERLIEVARAALGEHGLDVGVADIAGRAGVGEATLFRHFESKDELVLVALEREFAAFEGIVGDCLAEADPWTAVERLLTECGRLYAQSRGLFAAFKTLLPANAERLAPRGGAVLRDIEEILCGAKRAGVLRDDVEPRDIGPLLTAAAQAVQVHSFPGRPELWRRYLGIVLDGLRPEGATPLPEPPPSEADIARARGSS